MIMTKKFTSLVFTLFIVLSSYTQTAVYVFNGQYKYFLGNSEPDSNWYKPDYNDSKPSWLQGKYDIGYGDVSDTGTVVEKAPSLFLRITFNVSDKDSFKAANFLTDFDDGFVAYLNGTEIARTNLGNPGDTIPYNRLADRSHEIIFPRADTTLPYYSNLNHPKGYYLDSFLLKKCIVIGTNVLAVQVNNDSVNGSDLMFNSILINLTFDRYNIYNNSYFVFPDQYLRQVRITSSKYPIVEVNTDEYGILREGVDYKAQMGIINNGNGKLNNLTDTFTDYNGRIAIHVRGNISRDVPKKSYAIETQDPAGNNNNTKLLGMPKDNDWILYGPFLDKSLIRNRLGILIGNKLGHYEPRMQYCDLIINGEYQGLYIFMEKIKQGKNRVDIAKLDSDDIAGDSLTGGYIFKYDKDRGAGVMDIVYPKNPTNEQNAYIIGYIRTAYAVLDKPYFIDDTLGYKKYFDVQSMLDYVIANETFKNCDSYLFSTYFFKDRNDHDGRLKYGPLWDLDLAFGNSPWQNGYITSGWQFNANRYLMIRKFFRDTSLVNSFVYKWFNLRNNGFLKTETIMATIDSLTNNVSDGMKTNYEVWPVLEKDFFSMWGYSNINVSSSYAGDVLNLKTWLQARLEWIDANIKTIYFPMPVEINRPAGNGTIERFEAFPNPFSERLSVTCDIANSGQYNFDIIDLSGRTINVLRSVKLNSGTVVVDLNNSSISNLSKGLYILSVSKNNTVIHQEKIVKY
jgi:hypothetical protein